MTVKEYLLQYKALTLKAARLKAEYEREQSEIDEIRSPLGGDGLPHGNEITKTVENRALRLTDKLLAYEEARIDALEKRQEIFDLLENVPGVMGDVLRDRYLYLLKWDEISVALNYSLSAVHYQERKGLKYLATKLVLFCTL
jgi:DNA-directed RNA polymerase specialized sigma24 family protein